MKTWIIYIIIALGVYFFYETTQANRDASGTIVAEGNIDAFQMKVGDCFNDSEDSLSEEVEEVFGVDGIPCSTPHDNEVFAVFDIPLGDFPGEEKLSDIAFDSCLKYFPKYVGKSYEESSLDIFPIYPTLQSWTQSDDKEVVCALYNLELKKLTGSVKGRGL